MLDFVFEAATRVHEETRTGRGKKLSLKKCRTQNCKNQDRVEVFLIFIHYNYIVSFSSATIDDDETTEC